MEHANRAAPHVLPTHQEVRKLVITPNVCGIPWNWSLLHHRGKSILDMAGRSLSCGLSDSKSAAGRKSEAADATSGGRVNASRPLYPVKSERLASSTSSDSDVL